MGRARVAETSAKEKDEHKAPKCIDHGNTAQQSVSLKFMFTCCKPTPSSDMQSQLLCAVQGEIQGTFAMKQLDGNLEMI